MATSSITALLLVAREAGLNLDPLVPLLRAIPGAARTDALEVRLRYRRASGDLILVVIPEDPELDLAKTAARLILQGAGLQFRTRWVTLSDLDRLLTAYDLAINDVRDPEEAVARLRKMITGEAPLVEEPTAVSMATTSNLGAPLALQPKRFPGSGVRATFETKEAAPVVGLVRSLSRHECFIEHTSVQIASGVKGRLFLTDGQGKSEHVALVTGVRGIGDVPLRGEPAGLSLRLLSQDPKAEAAFERFAAEVGAVRDDGRFLRTESRLPVHLRVTYETPGAATETLAENIGSGGIFLQTDSPPEPGTLVDVIVNLPDQDDLTLKGEVRHVRTAEEATRSGTKPGVGVRFVDPDPATSQRVRRYLDGLVRRHRARVLVVDDDALARRMLTDAFDAAGYETVEAKSGQEALDMILDELLTIDLVLLDVQLPERNGPEVMVEIRKFKTAEDLPVIFISGTVVDADEQRVLTDLGASDFLVKGREFGPVIQAVDRAIWVKHHGE